jgi:beta-lactamase class A
LGVTEHDFKAALEAITSGFSGALGLAAKRLDDGQTISHNETEVFQAASVVKLPLLLDALQRVERGELDLEHRYVMRAEDRAGGSGVLKVCDGGLGLTVHDLLRLMIVVSDNTATNMMLDILGGLDAINARFAAMGLETTRAVGKLQVPWEFKTEIQRQGHSANITPLEILGLLERLWNGEILQPETQQMALEILTQQQYTEIIARYLPEGTRTATKSGFQTGVRNDVGFVWFQENSKRAGQVYAVAIASKDGQDLRYHVDNEGVLATAKISRLVYDFFLD